MTTGNNSFNSENPFDKKDENNVNRQTPFSGNIPQRKEKVTLKEQYESLRGRNTNFIFFFGKPASGKTHVMASLIYFMKTTELGDLITLESNSREAQLLVDEMFKAIQTGTTLAATPSQIGSLEPPTEIDFLFKPKDKDLPDMRFTFLEMSGENLEIIQMKKNRDETGYLPETIDIFLRCPGIRLFFFLLTSHDEAFNDANLLNRFLDYAFGKNSSFHTARYLLAITKWDTYRGKYKDINAFAEQTLPQVYNRLRKEQSTNAITNYSLGKFEKDQSIDGDTIDVLVKNDTVKAELVTTWLYEHITGVSLIPELTLWQKLLHIIGFN